MDALPRGSRITFKQAKPNPLFQGWLEELHKEAVENNSNFELVVKEALTALSKYPLPLQSGTECAILKGFDKKLCAYLDKRLEVHNYNKNLLTNNSSPKSSDTETYDLDSPIRIDCEPKSPIITNSHSPVKTNLSEPCNSNSLSPVNINLSSDNQENAQSSASGSSKAKATKKKQRGVYKPAFRSGSYAILVGLLEHFNQNPDSPALKKEDLIDIAQKHSEESFTRPKPESFYTAWSNMTRLVTKGLVNKRKNGRKIEYFLTDEGISKAQELLKEYANTPTANDIIFNGASPQRRSPDMEVDIVIDRPIVREATKSPVPVLQSLDAIEMPPGSFDVILLIDKCETSGLSNKHDPTVGQFKKYPDLKHEYRSLKVGDFTWVAQHKTNKDQELVLPYVVERKRMDDLGSSIKDGRFHEQKFRLRKSGLKNVIYLVENYGSNKHVGLPIQSLMQALQNTRVQDNFKVHETDSLKNSARFLAMMTKRLTIEYKDKHLKGYNREPQGDDLMTFSFLNQASKKTKPLTVTETFIKLLLQLKGASVEKALAITEVYKTPHSLIEAYENCSQKEGEFLLANLKYGDLSRNVGPTVSKSVYHLFSNINLA
ncbi:crossover junction endonuclease MUS81 [Leguminivora glycinivorella]|uniref:crossover junction endonuclease MUS81 n=1 Tax=Leguminivora glycinivorella TaxID=1035111 RepID=UPI00200C3F3F|nr:crossover junction endonuclease MUS81 [Leguminivora glycinivorella]XP_047990285.1 crossover junction endonuclease MUS81 [Leguminivora glycinivorella]